MTLTAKEKRMGISEGRNDRVVSRETFLEADGNINVDKQRLTKRERTMLKNIEASKMIEAHNKLRNFTDEENISKPLAEVRDMIKTGSIDNSLVIKALEEKIASLDDKVKNLEMKKMQQDDFLIAGEENSLKLFKEAKIALETQRDSLLPKKE